MSHNVEKSVLSFYAIDENLISGMNFIKIWEDFVVVDNSPKCTNVFSFEMTPFDLYHMLESGQASSELLKDIEKEYKSGASFMFVKPITERPIAGYFIGKYIVNLK